MPRTLIVLMAAVLLAVLVLIAHLWHEPHRARELDRRLGDQAQLLERLSDAVQRQEQTLSEQRIAIEQASSQRIDLAPLLQQQQELGRRLEHLLSNAATQTAPNQNDADPQPETGDATETTPSAPVLSRLALATPAGGTGIPALDADFLLPYDGSHYEASKVGGTVRLFGSTPPGLNDILESAADTSNINALVNDTLCDKDVVDIELWRANLAVSVRISDDWKTFTFRLREGVRWQVPRIARSDARFAWLREAPLLTAHDFVFALAMIKDPVTECPHLKSYFQDLASFEAPDDHTFIVRWSEANYTNIGMSMSLAPLPRHVYTRNADGSLIPEADLGLTFNKHWFDEANQLIGVGRYLLDDFRHDNHIHFRRNPGYWGANWHFDRIEWDSVTKDPIAQLTAFKNGDVHSHGLTASQFKTQIVDHSERRFAAIDAADPKSGRRGELGWERTVGNSYTYIGWNLRRPLFSDRRVRQALSHALPQERIIREVFHGLGRPQITNVHIDSVYGNRDLKAYNFDLGRARRLLSEAGWSDSDGDGLLDKVINGQRTTFRFTIKHFSNSPEWEALLNIYRGELLTIGIEMRLMNLEWPVMVKAYQDQDFDAVSGGWRLGGDVDFFQLWHSEEADKLQSSNHVGFKNARADALALELRRSFNLADRIRIAQEFQAIIHEEQPYTFLRSTESVFTWQNRRPSTGSVKPNTILDGVIPALDRNHPFTVTDRSTWFFPR